MKELIQLRQYDELACINESQISEGNITFSGESFSLKKEQQDASVTLRLQLLSEKASQIQLSLSFIPEYWSNDVYLLLPAASYNGNRFKARRTPYPPKPVLMEDMVEDPELLIGDVPRLSQKGPSCLHITTGDETTPSICWYDPHQQTSTLILMKQGNQWGNYGIKIEENESHTEAKLCIESPVMRQRLYKDCRTDHPSWDHAVDLQKGDEICITYTIDQRPAQTLQDLFTHFVHLRKSLETTVKLNHQLPFSAAWTIQQRKLNRDNWNEAYGYYAVGTRNCWEGDNHNVGQDWQPGWTGGGINSLPLLIQGDEQSKERALSTLNFMYTKGQASSGLLYSMHHQGNFYDDTFHHETPNQWSMIRKNTDALYFTLKHLLYLKKENIDIPEAIESGAQKLAQCLDSIWNQYKQFGQFFDVNTAKLLVGGTLSGSLGSGALALASHYFNQHNFLETAKRAARCDYENHIQYGLTTAGPGEILQAPDSESAFSMLESFMVLYEVTSENEWLTMACDTADQCTTWCASYDYAFPNNSIFGKKNIRATGSVWANVQNKHSSPGICTFSGDSLLKLYRATGKQHYLDLITEIAHNLPQYMVRENYSLGDMQEGWICERVNFSDWEGPENIGGNLFGSCWPEASLALTVVEIPGLYIQTDTHFIHCIDHIEAKVISSTEEGLEVRIHNPCSYKAEVKILIETSQQSKSNTLGQLGVYNLPTLILTPNETKSIHITNNNIL